VIRIELRPRRHRRWLPVVLLVAAASVLVVAGVAFRERLPGLGSRAAVPGPAAVAPVASPVDADSIPLVFAPVRQDAATADTAKARTAVTSPVADTPTPEKPVSSPPSVSAVVVPTRATKTGSGSVVAAGVVLARGSGNAGRRSTPCSRTLDLCARLPAGVHLTALACDPGGTFTLEGTGASPRQIEAFLDTLREAGSRAVLSWWSDGPSGADGRRACRFAYRGQHRAESQVEPPAVSPAQATAAFTRLATLARQAGLAGVTAAPATAEAPATTGTGRQRQQLSATGSPEQIGAFLNRLRSAPVPTVLTEVVVASESGAGQPTDRTRLAATVEAVVLRP
jgi:hypothetical protein